MKKRLKNIKKRLIDLIPNNKELKFEGVISDQEFAIINRRDFIHGESNATAAFLDIFSSVAVSYEMRSMLDLMHSLICRIDKKTDVRIHQLSQTMTLPSVFVFSLISDRVNSIKLFAPRGLQKLPNKNEFTKELLNKFDPKVIGQTGFNENGKGRNGFDIIFCNSSKEADVISGVKLFSETKKGFIFIKGYGRRGSPNCGDHVLAQNLNIHCSLSGFGFAASL
jgi:hypothetical protein